MGSCELRHSRLSGTVHQIGGRSHRGPGSFIHSPPLGNQGQAADARRRGSETKKQAHGARAHHLSDAGARRTTLVHQPFHCHAHHDAITRRRITALPVWWPASGAVDDLQPGVDRAGTDGAGVAMRSGAACAAGTDAGGRATWTSIRPTPAPVLRTQSRRPS